MVVASNLIKHSISMYPVTLTTYHMSISVKVTVSYSMIHIVHEAVCGTHL